MPATTNWLTRIRTLAITIIAIALTTIVGAYAFTDIPSRLGLAKSTQADIDNDHDPHAGHDHAGHSDTESIELSPQARANMQLRTDKVKVGVYTKYIEVPGVITNWPGRTHVAVASPLTGVLNSILISRGELVKSGTPLFTLRLTHQDLVNTQQTFLTQLGELDVEEREIQRLSAIASSGAIAGKTLLTRKYERDKLLVGVKAARQAMLLHGLNEEQIEKIETTRQLVREVTVYAPTLHEDHSLHHDAIEHDHVYQASDTEVNLVSMMQPPAVATPHRHIEAEFVVTQLTARRGQSVEAGDELAQLSDFSEILIEGHAFQRDAQALTQAAETEADVQAILDNAGDETTLIDGLKVVYIGTEVGRQSRALPFYVAIANEIERTETRGTKRYVSWRYKPGQRLTVRLPVKKIKNAIIVPKDAVAEEGSERYLFVENGNHFDRVPVAVVARDSISAAIANDGQVWPGQSIAVTGAHQLQMAVKNKSGGAIDPHAGHNH
ncbi:MAG: HlyD family efflux transporter periplasmic adaptor subunit [Pirellulaceae bacterium]|nr:HlyD family efflux transporter periplasmic adaptor subunit [Pirellulaceae bacterium]